VAQQCGYKLQTGGGCRQLVSEAKHCAAGHPAAPKDQDGGLQSGVCEMIETDNGWACRSHDLGSEQWRVAIALGARPPCRVPGGVEKRTRMALDKRSKPLTLQLLARDEDVTVRRGVASNPNTPVSVLERLAEDEEEWVRQWVARNPSTPASTLERLAEDENKWVRHGVASNPNTPVSILERLAKSEDVMVRGLALRRLS